MKLKENRKTHNDSILSNQVILGPVWKFRKGEDTFSYVYMSKENTLCGMKQ
jgi:hypothetical protein